MSLLEPHPIQCPYCCQMIDVTVDSSVRQQEYIEDCQICCRPIVLRIDIDDEQIPTIEARMENE